MIIWTFPIPAHGGSDPGTSANGIVEKDYTLKISQYMADRLNDLGIENTMARTGDTTLSSSDRPGKAQSLFGKGNDVIMVSNHINAALCNKVCITIKAKKTLFKRIMSFIIINTERKGLEPLTSNFGVVVFYPIELAFQTNCIFLHRKCQ